VPNELKCPVCGTVMERKYEKRRHIRTGKSTRHEITVIFMCPNCGYQVEDTTVYYEAVEIEAKNGKDRR